MGKHWPIAILAMELVFLSMRHLILSYSSSFHCISMSFCVLFWLIFASFLIILFTPILIRRLSNLSCLSVVVALGLCFIISVYLLFSFIHSCFFLYFCWEFNSFYALHFISLTCCRHPLFRSIRLSWKFVLLSVL